MYVPGYTITSEILNNVANIEYGKAAIEAQKVLPHWEGQLQKEAKTRAIKYGLESERLVFDEASIKSSLDNLSKKAPKEIANTKTALDLLSDISRSTELDEVEIKEIHRKLTFEILPQTKQGRYRSTKLEGGVNPEEILAEMVELFDWYNSLDAKKTHPILTSGVMLSRLEKIKPFVNFNSLTAKLTARACLKIGGYSINDYYALEEFFNSDKLSYLNAQNSSDEDLTGWLEYFTGAMASEILNIKEKVVLLARDTKLAKASGRVELTKRQEKIIEFLQDYGLLQNKAFAKLFPKVSEDSILRDLKVLIEEGIVVKRGKTKSSRYELK